MKWPQRLPTTALLLVLSGLGAPAGAGPEAAFHVSAAVGDDAASGTAEAPFRTMARAQQAVRDRITGGMTADVVVTIHAGDYPQAEPLRFGPNDGGRDGHRVIYRAGDGGRVRILGADRVTGWEAVEGGVYRAPVATNRVFRALFENGDWCTPARTPNEGYFLAEAGSQGVTDSTVTYKAEDFSEPFDASGAFIAVWAGGFGHGHSFDWFETLSPVASVDEATRTFTLSHPGWWHPTEGNRYYVAGARAFLDAPGEYYLDSDAGTLYYRPRALPIEEQVITAPTVLRLIDIAGDPMGRPVERLTFEGLTFDQSDSTHTLAPGDGTQNEAMIHVVNARHVTFRDCMVRNAGVNAFAFNDANQGHTIQGCVVEDVGYCAVMAAGVEIGKGPFTDAAAAYISRDFRIRDNVFRRTGRRVGHGSGIWIYQSGGHDIAHNLFDDMPRYGINILGYSYNYMRLPREKGGLDGRIYGIPITWDNHLDFLYARDIRIARNEFRRLMTNSQDGGAITAWAPGAGNVIENNLVHDMQGFSPTGILVGIYLDDAAKHFQVRRNVVTGLRGPGAVYPLCIKGVSNTVENNIVAGNASTAAIYSVQAGLAGLAHSPEGIEDERVGGLRFLRNVIAIEGESACLQFRPWHDEMLDVSDHNLVYHPQGRYEVSVSGRRESWEEWRRRQGGKYDAGTVLADPRFADPARGDYTLLPDSPAVALGIESVDLRGIGVRRPEARDLHADSPSVEANPKEP